MLAADQEIEALRTQLGQYRKAQADRPGLVMFQQESEHSAREILQSLGKPRDLAVADSLRLRVDEPL